MGKYLFQVLVAFVFWACVIWFGLPLVKAYAPPAYKHLTDFFLTDAKVEKIFAAVVTKAEQTVKAVTPSNAFSNTPSSVPMRNDGAYGMQADEKAADVPQMAAQTAQPTQDVTTSFASEENVEDPAEAVEEAVVIDDPFAALNKDPGYGWGLVVTNSFAYDKEMNRLGILSGGTVVSRKNSELKMYGYVSECFYLKERKWQSDTMLLYEADLVMFDGTYEEANVEQRNLLIKYCQTLARYEELRAEAYKNALRRNPHLEAYKKTMEEYNDFFRKANAAKAALPQSVGAVRTKLIDDLRRYRAEESIIVKKFKEVKERYEAWKIEHVGSYKNPKISKSVDILNLETALNAMKPRVQMIVPGL